MINLKRFKNHIDKIQKREGEIVDFDRKKIEEAILKALTVSEEGGRQLAKELSLKVTKLLNRRFKKGEIPNVEQIQDVVEEVLILENLVETAKAYILYREQRRLSREARITLKEAVSLVDEYFEENNWEVKENSNMAFSLQGLNHYVSAHIAKKYWLNKIYPPEVRKASENGDFHVHNLDILGAYCCGWDLYDLLLKGFGGVFGKIQSKPPKHFRTALGQVVNFFYTLQGESAGAQAFSNFDTLLAPFIRYDNLSYREIKQAFQEFLFNCNVPTRVGFQCLSEDTEILTSEGWKNYKEVEKGNKIITFNIKNKTLEVKKVDYVFKKYYQGIMYRLKNRIQDQLISPRHRVVRRRVDTKEYCLEPIEDILKFKSPFIIPLAGLNKNPDAFITDSQIKLMAWIIAKGDVELSGKYHPSYRISIYQSPTKNRKNYEEIINLLKHFKLKYSEYKVAALEEEVSQLRLDAKSSEVIHRWFNTKERVHFIPEILLNLSQRQSRLFLETYLKAKADGFEGCKIFPNEIELLNGLERICVYAGYGFTVLKRKPTVGKEEIYILRIIKHPETYISKIGKVNYKGFIWSVHTENETVIARRNGKVFITGNTPFENITLDLKVPEHLKEMPVIIGGQPQKETYKEFQKEMDIFNQALTEVYVEGDSTGRVFTFPIPTYNITKDFEWDNNFYEGIWQMTAKYGIPYFSNFINSDMKPEDARSMCCRLRLDNRELYKRGGGLFGANPLTGSIGVVTINLPRIGYLSKTKKEFFERLAQLMDLAKTSLEIKRKVLEKWTEKGLYPYSRFYLSNVQKMRGGYWGNHFATIGIIGMNEALLNFMGVNIADKKGREFALEVLDFMRERLIKYQEETGNLYNLEATPAEGTSYRLALIDKKEYPDIITSGEKQPFYTNSTQLPIDYTDDLFEALKLQDELQIKYTGGTVFHAFLGEAVSDTETVKSLIKTIFEKFKLPYFTLSPTFSVCPIHGYIPGEHFTCPKCLVEQPCEVYSRIVGYLRPVQQWHFGKQEEFRLRKTFKI
ncbi:MAG: ribonucleoside triphosphate reductase [Minisyncoccia bacterium]